MVKELYLVIEAKDGPNITLNILEAVCKQFTNSLVPDSYKLEQVHLEVLIPHNNSKVKSIHVVGWSPLVTKISFSSFIRIGDYIRQETPPVDVKLKVTGPLELYDVIVPTVTSRIIEWDLK